MISNFEAKALAQESKWLTDRQVSQFHHSGARDDLPRPFLPSENPSTRFGYQSVERRSSSNDLRILMSPKWQTI